MALSNSSISNLEGKLKNIEIYINYGTITGRKSTSVITLSFEDSNYLYDCWNTFDYVSKNLKEWADDTVVGAEIKSQLTRLSKILIDVINETLSVTKRLKKFCEKQSELNNINRKYSEQITKYNEAMNKWNQKYN